jgi:hypothetical protein
VGPAAAAAAPVEENTEFTVVLVIQSWIAKIGVTPADGVAARATDCQNRANAQITYGVFAAVILPFRIGDGLRQRRVALLGDLS